MAVHSQRARGAEIRAERKPSNGPLRARGTDPGNRGSIRDVRPALEAGNVMAFR